MSSDDREEIVDIGGSKIAREMDDSDQVIALLAAAKRAGFDPTASSPAFPGGSGASFGGFADVVQSDTPVTLACDGTFKGADCLVASPPEWLDSASNIILPGLYAGGVAFQGGVAPTTPGLFILGVGVFNVNTTIWLDAIAGGFGMQAGGDSQALGSADLPYNVSPGFQLPTDLTATVLVTVYLVRLAH